MKQTLSPWMNSENTLSVSFNKISVVCYVVYSGNVYRGDNFHKRPGLLLFHPTTSLFKF